MPCHSSNAEMAMYFKQYGTYRCCDHLPVYDLKSLFPPLRPQLEALICYFIACILFACAAGSPVLYCYFPAQLQAELFPFCISRVCLPVCKLFLSSFTYNIHCSLGSKPPKCTAVVPCTAHPHTHTHTFNMLIYVGILLQHPLKHAGHTLSHVGFPCFLSHPCRIPLSF